MRKALLWLCMQIPVLPALAGEPLPSDVQRFIDGREGCDHMRGEMPDSNDRRRMRDVNRDIQRLCNGTDKELSRLKRKYAKSPSVMRKLGEFESSIEEVVPPASRG